MEPEYNEILQLAADFARNELESYEQKNEEAGVFDKNLFHQMGELGLTGLVAAEKHGGLGLGYEAYALFLEEIARFSSSYAVTIAVNGLPQIILEKHGSEEQQQRWIPDLASGKKLGAFALTEPQSGSDAAAMKVTAEKSDGAYVLNGRKQFITHGGVADAYMVLARTSNNGSRGISCFYVESPIDGLQAAKPENKMGWRVSPTTGLVFEDVRVPAENRIGTEGIGFSIAMKALDSGRITIGATAVGIARRALEESLKYVKSRSAFGSALKDMQGVQWMLADMDTAVSASRLLVLEAARRKDAGRDFSRQASQAKLFATDTAMQVTTDAVQLLGGYGYTKEYPVERLMRDAKATQIVEGTNQIQRNIIAKHLVKKLNAGDLNYTV